MRLMNRPRGRALAVCLLCSVLPLWADGSAVDGAGVAALRSEIELLKQMLAGQQRQIDELRQSLQPAESPSGYAPIPAPLAYASGSASVSDPRPSTLAQVAPAAPAVNVSDLNNPVTGLLRGLGGFRFSGDFRYRFDLQDRSGNAVAGPLQNARSRYRLRFNVDKDLFLKDDDERPLAHAHIQLSTAPYSQFPRAKRSRR